MFGWTHVRIGLGENEMKKNFNTVLAIDPGKYKCGVALVHDHQLVIRDVVEREELIEFVTKILPGQGVIVVGDRTGSERLITELKKDIASERIFSVDEHMSTVEARKKYWAENPPRGWRRLIPTSLQVPPVPLDGYVAEILAERFLRRC